MIILTGIKPTGVPHLGNYFGAIAPALAYQDLPDHRCLFFIADYHALVNQPSSELLARHSLEVAATWLASGLDPNQALLYRQSDIPEIFELQWILACFTAKGVLNRSHAYKAKLDQNPPEHPDDGITMGLFNYPVLMAADILISQATWVPVGVDQQQHVEITRDLALKFHHHYGQDVFTIPQIKLTPDKRPLPGLDGRKMSKSYHNHVPLFLPKPQLQKLIAKIPTDSSPPAEPKATTGVIYELHKALSSPDELAALDHQYAQGCGWGELKAQLAAKITHDFAQATERYHAFINRPTEIEDILAHGAAQLRPSARKLLEQVKSIVGLPHSSKPLLR